MSRWKVHGFIPIWVVNRDMRAFGRYNANYGCPQLRRKVACLHSLVAGPAAESRNRDPEAVAVVIGSSRGIGLAITQELIRRFQGKIFACCRNPGNAGTLNALRKFVPERFETLQLDVTQECTIVAAAEHVSNASNNRVDLLINTAGILHRKEEGHMPERNISELNAEWAMENFRVNTLGPAQVAKHFSPLMVTSRKPGRVFSVFASISARVSSISDNRLGGWYSYRMTKCGLNQMVKTLSLQVGRRGMVCVTLHPGTVDTDLSQPFQQRVNPEKLFPVDKAAFQLLDVIDRLESEDTGKLFAYDGSEIPF